MGITGAGKSTFINSISNFLMFETLEEAIQRNIPYCPIRVEFDLQFRDTDRKTQRVHVNMEGSSPDDKDNERFGKQGSSCTLNPRVYSFTRENIEFNIIDVPGLADTGGFRQDEINKKAIIQQIGRFEEIHAICIVVQASMDRLTPEFKYCFNEIFSCLNRSAINNLVFIVTNSAGHDFTTGLADAPLNAYIDELNQNKNLSLSMHSNVFCIDNDAFKFLIGWNQSSTFRKAHKNNVSRYSHYEESWKVSREAVFKLFEKIYKMNAYRTEDTMSIARSNTIIRCILPSLSIVIGRIAIGKTPEQKQQIISSLMKDGTMSKPDIEIQKSEKPQLVCIHKQCLKQVIDPRTKTKFVDFSNPCHENCIIRGIDKAPIGHPALEDCEKIDLQGYCRKCGHSYKSHLHTSYRIIKTASKVNTGSRRPFTRKEADNFYTTYMERLEAEKETIFREIIVLATFLRKNAVVEYNTAFEERLTLEIRTEEEAGNIEAVKNLRESINSYRRHMSIIDTTKNAKERKVEIANVQNSLDNLFNLPLYGKTVKALYESELPPSETADPYDFVRQRVKYLPEIN